MHIGVVNNVQVDSSAAVVVIVNNGISTDGGDRNESSDKARTADLMETERRWLHWLQII